MASPKHNTQPVPSSLPLLRPQTRNHNNLLCLHHPNSHHDRPHQLTNPPLQTPLPPTISRPLNHNPSTPSSNPIINSKINHPHHGRTRAFSPSPIKQITQPHREAPTINPITNLQAAQTHCKITKPVSSSPTFIATDPLLNGPDHCLSIADANLLPFLHKLLHEK
jgi:hypothetical protein